MYLINKESNEATAIQKKTFSELGFKERQNLQEWICKNTEILAEELLIIQKEFDGFSDTSERLDLLALDKEGNLVLIENKLDDSGKDVIWQSIKYAAYCSTLNTEEIVAIYQKYLDGDKKGKSAREEIENFINAVSLDELRLNANDQRIILVAANFRKEVTSAVMWLMKHGISVKCMKVTPYKHADDIFLDVEQIIPVPDIEEYIIKLNEKERKDTKSATWTEERYMAAVKSDLEPDAVGVYTDIYERMKRIPTRIAWGSGKNHGGYFPVYDGKQPHWIFEIWANGWVEILFQYCRAPFDDLEKRKELRAKIKEKIGVEIPDNKLSLRPSISWKIFKDEDKLKGLVEIFEWYIEEVKKFEGQF